MAVDVIINQRDKDVLCIYCAIGQRSSGIVKVIEDLRRHDAMAHTVVVVAEGSDPPGLQYIAPYAVTSIGEFFMEQGWQALFRAWGDLPRRRSDKAVVCLVLGSDQGMCGQFNDTVLDMALEYADRLASRGQTHGPPGSGFSQALTMAPAPRNTLRCRPASAG